MRITYMQGVGELRPLTAESPVGRCNDGVVEEGMRSWLKSTLTHTRRIETEVMPRGRCLYYGVCSIYERRQVIGREVISQVTGRWCGGEGRGNVPISGLRQQFKQRRVRRSRRCINSTLKLMRNVSLTVPPPPPPLSRHILDEEVAAECGYACACVYALTQCTKRHSAVIAITVLRRRRWRLMCFDS